MQKIFVKSVFDQEIILDTEQEIYQGYFISFSGDEYEVYFLEMFREKSKNVFNVFQMTNMTSDVCYKSK